MTGYQINWNVPKGNQALFNHPLYIKYASSPFEAMDLNQVKADLRGVMATADSAPVCAYLSWVIRTLGLVA